MSVWQVWIPPVPPPRQNPAQVEAQHPPLDETPLIKAIVDQMKAYQRGNPTDGMSDIELMIKKLKDYAHCNPLYISILSPLNSENDIADIDSLYKDIDLVVWTYQFYDKYLSSPRNGGSTEHSPTSPLSLLSYPDFVEQVFQSFIVPTIRHINATNHNRVYSTVNGDRDGIPDTSTIMDLILCGTDIPIPESIYDLPKVLHEALEQTKHPPSTTTSTDTPSSSQVSLVFMNRNEQLQNHDLRDALRCRDEGLAKIYLEEETVRYNMLYLYILAHIAINVTSVHIRPFNNGNVLTLSSHASFPQLLNWKDTFQKMIGFHTFYSVRSMSYLVPLMIPIVELDWYCHPTKACASSTNVMAPRIEETLIAFSRYAHDVSLESIISDLLKDRHINYLLKATKLQKYVIQSVFCERLLNYVQYVQDLNLPRAADHDGTVYDACLKLMRYDSLDQRSYYADCLVPLLTKMNRQRQETGRDLNGPPPHFDDYRTYPVLPRFCIKNDYPYHVHVIVYTCYHSRYEAAIRIVRSLCSGFKELEMNQSIGYNCSGNGIVYDNRKNSDRIYIPNSEIDIQIISTDDINSLYEIIFQSMLSHDYRIIIYNHADYNPQRKPDIYNIIRCGTPPYWNTRYDEAPVRAFTTVLQNFRNYVCDTATMCDVTRDYIDLVCQQVLLRLVYCKYRRSITSIPSDLCIDVLPQELLNLIPTDVSQLPTNQLFDPRAEPRYITTINNEIQKIITKEIAIPSSWFGDNCPRQVGKKLSQDDTAQVDIHWSSRIDDYFCQHHQTPEMNENIDSNANKIATATDGMSEEATRLVAYALSKMESIDYVNGSNFDSDTYMNEVRHETDVQMDNVHVCRTTEQQPSSSQNDQNDTAVHQDLPQRQQTTMTASDIDRDNDAALFDDINAKRHTSDGDNDCYESEEFDDDDDDSVEADVCDGDEVDEEDGQQYLQQHTVGSNIEDAIDIDDGEDEDDDDDDDESANDYDASSPSDGGNRGRVEDNMDNEMDVEDETETENVNDDDSTDEVEDDDESASEDADDDIEENVDEENKYQQEEHDGNEHLEEDVHHAALPARGDINGIVDNIEQTEQRSANAQEKDDIETRANELDIDDDNVQSEDSKQRNIPAEEVVKNIEGTHSEEFRVEDRSKEHVNNNLGYPKMKDDVQIDLPTHDASISSQSKTIPAIRSDVNQSVPLGNSSKSELSSLQFPQNDPEAGYEAEDSQDAGTDDDDNEYQHDASILQDGDSQKRLYATIMSSTRQAAAVDPPMVEHKAVSTLIDKGYEPDTQEGRTDVDFIHHIDPEAGYEAEDSQDAGTEEENDDHHPSMEVTSGDPSPEPMMLSVEPSASSIVLPSHQEDALTMVDQGYEPDPESQGQTDVDGVPQQVRLMESGYDGEESQCHTEDDIHTEDEHQAALPSDFRWQDAGDKTLPQQFIRPAASADGMIADDEMEAESSEVEMADGGSSSLKLPSPALDTRLNKDNISGTRTGNLLTQIATNIQNEHSHDSLEKNHLLNVSNPHNETTARRIEYNIPPIDGDDEEDDESSDSVRSKPGDEISCPMSETHSSQSSVGMRSAAKSTVSGEASQPTSEAVPILEIRTKTSAETALPSPMKLTGKRNATSAKKPPKPPKKVAQVGNVPLTEKRSTRSAKVSGTSANDTVNSYASYKKPPLIKLSTRSTRSTNASVSVAHGAKNSSSPAGLLKDPSTGKQSTTGRSTKEVANVANGTQSISPPNIMYQKPPLIKRSTRSTNASSTAVNDTQNLSSQTVSEKETPTRKLRSTRSTPSGANAANDTQIASSPTVFNKETPTGKRSTRSTQTGVNDEPPAKKRSTQSTKASTGTAVDDTHSTTSSNVSNRRTLRSTSAAQTDTPSRVLRPPANERRTRSTNAKSVPNPSPSVASTRSTRSRK